MRARRASPEQTIQRAVIAHLRQRGARDLFWFHVPNGGKRKPIEAAILKGLGTTPGIPDLILVHQGRVYGLELKAEGGRVSENQLKAIAALERAGAFTCVAEGLDRAIAVLEQWGLLLGVADIGIDRRVAARQLETHECRDAADAASRGWGRR